MTTTNSTVPLRSFPHVSSRARHHWQTRVARIAAAETPGIGLAFCVRRLRERRFIKLSQLHGQIVRHDGQAIRVTGFQGRRVPYGVAFDKVCYEVDLLKGPGFDSERQVPRGHHELLLGSAVHLANGLVNQPPRWINRSTYELPRLFADFGDHQIPTPDGPEIEAACRNSNMTPRMVMSRDTVHHNGRRLVPLEYVGHVEEPFEIHVETASIVWQQPCGAATTGDLQFCDGAIEFNPLGSPQSLVFSSNAELLGAAA